MSLIEYPALAAAAGALFLVLYWMSRRPASALAAVAWLAYAGYETAMRLRWLCTGECNIRVDLLLIYPILLVVSCVAIVAVVRWRLKPRRP